MMNKPRRTFVFLPILLTATALAAGVPASREAARDRVGKKAPALRAKEWFNTPGGPPKLEGKVALIRFWTDGCPFCAKSAPALNEFHKEFGERGLVVIGMYHPKPLGRKADADEVRAAARDLGFQFPIGIDEDWRYINEIWLESGDHERSATSASFLVDREGIIRWAHPGTEYFKSEAKEDEEANRDYAELRRAIEVVLAETGEGEGGKERARGAAFADKKRAAWILVTPEGPKDGGDFGPLTPGTKTAGIQEALDHAKIHHRDVYIAGGAVPEAFKGGAVYSLQETLRVPWMQDFLLDGGEAVIDYGPATGDAIVFDSQMSCRYKLGLVVCHSDGAAVRLAPRAKGPDNFSVITTSVFEINALVGAGSVFPGEGVRGKGTGLLFDGSSGSIDSNKFAIVEIVACDVGIDMRHGTNNYIEAPLVHLCNTHIAIGEPGKRDARFNRLDATLDSQGIKASAGIVFHGQHNLATIHFAGASPGRGIVFGADARDNTINALSPPQGIANDATIPTNRVVPLYAEGLAVETPPFPASGAELVNRSSMRIEAIITAPGEVREWSRAPAEGEPLAFKTGLIAGQSIWLEPGDRVRFDYSSTPDWKWRATR